MTLDSEWIMVTNVFSALFGMNTDSTTVDARTQERFPRKWSRETRLGLAGYLTTTTFRIAKLTPYANRQSRAANNRSLQLHKHTRSNCFCRTVNLSARLWSCCCRWRWPQVRIFGESEECAATKFRVTWVIRWVAVRPKRLVGPSRFRIFESRYSIITKL